MNIISICSGSSVGPGATTADAQFLCEAQTGRGPLGFVHPLGAIISISVVVLLFDCGQLLGHAECWMDADKIKNKRHYQNIRNETAQHLQNFVVPSFSFKFVRFADPPLT